MSNKIKLDIFCLYKIRKYYDQILAFGSPKSGNFHDLDDIESLFREILQLLEEAKIEHKGLFLNADAGFDSKKFRKILNEKEIIANIPKNPRNGENSDDDFLIFDEELYKNRFKIERSFAWLDGLKGLIMRYETLNTTWNAMLYLGLIKKIYEKSLNRTYYIDKKRTKFIKKSIYFKGLRRFLINIFIKNNQFFCYRFDTQTTNHF